MKLILCFLILPLLTLELACAADFETEMTGSGAAVARIAPGTRVLRDLAYGKDASQRLDVYLPAHSENAPVILMVHGGGWAYGDKAMRNVVENKVARWVPRGIILVSINYRLQPKADPRVQAQDVAAALGFAQQHARAWGGDPTRFVLMGHSAGAHLVALLEAEPNLAYAVGAHTWLGTVALDSGAYDVEGLMQRPHFPLFDRAFGQEPKLWREASPQGRMTQGSGHFLAVCSSRRLTSCREAQRFVAKAREYGRHAEVISEARSHGAINADLGADPAYTAAVESFMAALDAQLRLRLQQK